MSALGWVARTVLINGSSTGFTPPPRGAPRRASRRRTPAPPLLPGEEGAGDVGGAAGAAAAGPAGGEPAGRGAAVPGATSPASPRAAGEEGPAAEERQLQQYGRADDLCAGPLDQAGGGRLGAAGGEHVVHHQHLLPRAERVLVHLEGGASVLQLVALRVGGARQAAL